MSAITEYFSDVHMRLTELEESQRVTIAATATLGATAICDGRPIHIYDTGHLISHEFIARTGGLAAYTALTFGASLSRENEWVSAHRHPVDPSGGSSARLLVEWLFEQGTIQPKDPLILSSVSGTNALIVELALQAREREVSVIAVTGVDFSSELHSNHGSGKRLFEVADIVLDNRVPYGDSALAIDGLAMPAIAWSGLAGAALMWAVTAGIIERCLAAQTVPTVYTSYNLPGGEETYRTARETYRMTGR